MKITCLLDSLGGGGAERAMVILAGGLADRGHEVTLTTLSASIPDFHAVHPKVKRVRTPVVPGVCRWFNIAGQVGRIGAVKACVAEQNPDLIISFVDTMNILTLMAFPSGNPPVICCEQVNPEQYRLGAHWRILRRLLYPRAACVVMLTEDTLAWARSLRPRWRATAIPNPVSAPDGSAHPPRPEFFLKPRTILAMGRLTRQKGFDILLRSFAPIAADFPRWQLTILGEGPDREKLERLAHSLGCRDAVRMPGAIKTPTDVLKHADIFVLSSRFEGFPMALAEAMACGVPSISFDCPSGPGVLIRNGMDGILVPPGDEKALTNAIRELVGNEEKRGMLSKNATDVLHRFGVERYLDSWEKLLGDVTGGRRGAYYPHGRSMRHADPREELKRTGSRRRTHPPRVSRAGIVRTRRVSPWAR